jgi:HSP20 family protein
MDKHIGEIKGGDLENNVEVDDNAKETKGIANEKLKKRNVYPYQENQILTKDKDSTEEFLNDAKKTRLSAENILNELIAGIKKKEEKLGEKISDYKTECQTPLTDVLENDSTIVVRVDLPGVEREDISVNLIEKAIEVIALFPGKEDPGHYIQRERNYGKTIRVPLSKKINEKAVKSTFKDCILTIELPKLFKDRYKVHIN